MINMGGSHSIVCARNFPSRDGTRIASPGRGGLREADRGEISVFPNLPATCHPVAGTWSSARREGRYFPPVSRHSILFANFRLIRSRISAPISTLPRRLESQGRFTFPIYSICVDAEVMVLLASCGLDSVIGLVDFNGTEVADDVSLCCVVTRGRLVSAWSNCNEIVMVARSERIVSRRNGSNRVICSPLKRGVE